MATISSQEFFSKGPVTVVGNETTQKESLPEPSRLREGISKVASTYGENLKSSFNAGLERGAETFTTQPEALNKAIQEGSTKDAVVAAGRGALRLSGGVAQSLFSPITAAIQTAAQGYADLDKATGGRVADKIKSIAEKNPEVVEGVSEWITQNPEKVKDAEDILNFIGAKILPKANPVLQKSASTIKDVGVDVAEQTAKTVKNVSDSVFENASNLRNKVQVSIAKKNVTPQLESSAERLFLDGTERLENPLASYDRYLEQSKKAITDIKQDPAISEVGSKMGDAFTDVIKQRRKVGEVLGDELKNIGKIKISINEPKVSLINELKESGLSYNPRTKQLTSFQGSKFAPEEVTMLDNFVKGVDSLGDTPTVSQIDNFISKTRSGLQFTKGKSGVVGTTNAERIINGGIKKLRDSLDPQKNGVKELAPYWEANDAYAELSDFIEEGSGYLGKVTQSGDFAKDASLTKSAVQSVLNNGKKDWLIKLEALTGYKALDESVLALQAMKDAGDFRGLSMLQVLSEGELPTSKAGFTQKVLDMAIEKGEKLISGSPEEQTRALLQSLENKTKSQSTTKPNTASPASGGDSTSKINQSNSGIQDNSSTN